MCGVHGDVMARALTLAAEPAYWTGWAVALTLFGPNGQAILLGLPYHFLLLQN